MNKTARIFLDASTEITISNVENGISTTSGYSLYSSKEADDNNILALIPKHMLVIFEEQKDIQK